MGNWKHLPLRSLIGGVLVLLSLSLITSQALCQIQHQIVTTYGRNSFALGSDLEELITKGKLIKYSRAGLIDSFMVGSEKHYRLYVPVKAVWSNLPQYFDTAVIQLPDNILKQDLVVYDYLTEEAIIPDTLWIAEWEFSKKKIRKLNPIVKKNKNDYIYHYLSEGMKPAKHKQELDDKAKKEKAKKEKAKSKKLK